MSINNHERSVHRKVVNLRLEGEPWFQGSPSNSPSFHSRLNVDTRVPHDERDIMAIA